MSVLVMTWVFQHSRAKGNDRLVLLAIADRANDEGTDAWPSIDTLARKTLASQSTVKRSLRALVALGELQILSTGTGRTSNRYRVTMPSNEGGQIDPAQNDPGFTHDPPGGSPVTPNTSIRPRPPQPPGGGQALRCERHTRFRESCRSCVHARDEARRWPDWCGECDPDTRRTEDPDTRLDAGPCPVCHPSAKTGTE